VESWECCRTITVHRAKVISMGDKPLLRAKPISMHYTIASHYLSDARDFAERFDILWERQLHKTGRIKSFADLLMATECGLKCHVIIGRRDESIEDLYREVRRLSHEVAGLCASAKYLTDRSLYDELSARLAPFSVLIRYSLDAYETFFPSLMERDAAPIDHRQTIGRNPWVLETRALLATLIDSVSGEFSGLVTDDMDAIFKNEEKMRNFADKFIR
jgi:hypothetical protein